ncbi:MAG TPA: hypothetical protein VHG72_19510 [Polyangia bacterium]|nr:hypothetical protein [Polyangia bacterium]
MSPGWPAPRPIALAALLMALGASAGAGATSKHAPAHAKARPKAAAKCVAPKEEPPVPPVTPGAKVAVFSFTGDDAEPLRKQVMRLFKSKGLKLVTSLRSVDSAEQYREMAAALNLVAYIDGEVAMDGSDASATVFVRSGASGLRAASATFSGDRRQVTASLGKDLWEKLAPALGQACADAAKPRKPGREPMRINAGTPLTAADTAEAE